MITTFRHRRQRATLLLLALAFVAPRLLVAPGYMPGLAANGGLSVVACDPALRAALTGHVHDHSRGHGPGHSHADEGSCPFGMSGAPALLPVALAATLAPHARGFFLPNAVTSATGERLLCAHRARAPPRV